MKTKLGDDAGDTSKVDTVPPPAGETDAYNAPTRVAPLTADAFAALLDTYAHVRGAPKGDAASEAYESAPTDDAPVHFSTADEVVSPLPPVVAAPAAVPAASAAPASPASAITAHETTATAPSPLASIVRAIVVLVAAAALGIALGAVALSFWRAQ